MTLPDLALALSSDVGGRSGRSRSRPNVETWPSGRRLGIAEQEIHRKRMTMPVRSLIWAMIAASTVAGLPAHAAAADATPAIGSCGAAILAADIVVGTIAASGPGVLGGQGPVAASEGPGADLDPPESPVPTVASGSLVAAVVPVTMGGGCMVQATSDVVAALPAEAAVVASVERAPLPAEAPMTEPVPAAANRQAEAKAPVAATERAVASVATRRPHEAALPPTAARATAWWPAKPDDRFNLTYAGDASFTRAIALLFNGAFADPDAANRYIRVRSIAGEPVKGQWVVATNRRMLLFKAEPGRYLVEVGGGLQDRSGRTIAAAAQGLVSIP